MTIRAVIADDESLARRKLRMLLGKEPGVQVLAECNNGREAIAALRLHKPNLLLLDVEMPVLDGFGVLHELAPEETPPVVFTTAYDQYAVKAFEEEAMDYLVKPFDQERVHKALERVRGKIAQLQNGRDWQRWNGSGTDAPTPRADNRFVIKSSGRVIFLNTDDIDWIQAEANYVRFHVAKDSYLLRDKISSIAEKLDSAQFVRIHRSTIVNVTRIKELQPCNSGEYMVLLKDGTELSLSRSYRDALQPMLDRRL